MVFLLAWLLLPPVAGIVVGTTRSASNFLAVVVLAVEVVVVYSFGGSHSKLMPR